MGANRAGQSELLYQKELLILKLSEEGRGSLMGCNENTAKD